MGVGYLLIGKSCFRSALLLESVLVNTSVERRERVSGYRSGSSSGSSSGRKSSSRCHFGPVNEDVSFVLATR